MSGFIWLDVVDESGGSIVDATPSTKGVIKLTDDLGGDANHPSVVKINGATISAAGSLTIGNVLQVSGGSLLAYTPLNLAGGTNYITGILPTINQAVQSLNGDLSGTTSSAIVIKINGTSVASSPSINQILVSTSGTTSVWSQIVDGYISSSAAIAATKLAYNDASSPVLSATTVQSAIDAIKITAVATAIQRQSQIVTLANLQALGAVGIGTLNIGAVLPANARLLGAEINITQILAGTGLASALATVQSTIDTAGSIITGATVLATGFIGMNGTNQYMSRGGQQLTITIVLTGALFSALTGGQLTVNIFYTVVI